MISALHTLAVDRASLQDFHGVADHAGFYPVQSRYFVYHPDAHVVPFAPSVFVDCYIPIADNHDGLLF